MRAKVTMHSTKTLIVAAAVSLLGSAVALADVPGYEFMMLPEGMAMVVDSSGKATKAKISKDTAKTITDGAQPLSDAAIVLLYEGKLYVIPDKQVGDGRMMSSMVMSSAPNTNK